MQQNKFAEIVASIPFFNFLAFSRLSGVNDSTLHKIKNGKLNASKENAEKISEAFKKLGYEVSPEDLMKKKPEFC